MSAYNARVRTNGNDFMLILANGSEAKKWMTDRIYESRRSEI